jgi:hypothetical protein
MGNEEGLVSHHAQRRLVRVERIVLDPLETVAKRGSRPARSSPKPLPHNEKPPLRPMRLPPFMPEDPSDPMFAYPRLPLAVQADALGELNIAGSSRHLAVPDFYQLVRKAARAAERLEGLGEVVR